MSEEERWVEVDDYINRLLVGQDEILDDVIESSNAADLPAIQVSPSQGKLLMVLALAQRARSILEIGTLGGYSTIWLARALPPDGKLISLEVDAKHAAVARANVSRAGLSSMVEVLVGPALETLPRLAKERRGPFDLVFIDADKQGYTDYLEWSLKLSRSGTLIVADNVIWKGAVIDESNDDPNIAGVRRFNKALAEDPRVTATAIQTVGVKGYDGLAFAVVK